MSAYITLPTPITDEACLIEALADLGFDRSTVEVYPVAVPLVGYGGLGRGQDANVVIRREYIGALSNDLGFLVTATGYQALISDYDSTRFGKIWLEELHGHYQVHWAAKLERMAAEERRRQEEERKRLVEAQRVAVHEKAKKLGYQVKETREGEKLRLVLVKRIY